MDNFSIDYIQDILTVNKVENFRIFDNSYHPDTIDNIPTIITIHVYNNTNEYPISQQLNHVYDILLHYLSHDINITYNLWSITITPQKPKEVNNNYEN